MRKNVKINGEEKTWREESNKVKTRKKERKDRNRRKRVKTERKRDRENKMIKERNRFDDYSNPYIIYLLCFITWYTQS
jgi:hypothetical protein